MAVKAQCDSGVSESKNDKQPFSTRPELVYFNAKGRAEVIRLMFHDAGIEFTDTRIDHAQWPEMKKTSRWGGLPHMNVDGVCIAESHAIQRFVAKRLGYAGRNDLEQAQVEEVCEIIVDLDSAFTLAQEIDGAVEASQYDAARKCLKQRVFFSETLPRYLGRLEAFLPGADGAASESSEASFVLGAADDRISLAEFCLVVTLPDYIFTRFLAAWGGDEFRDSIPVHYPKIDKLIQRVRARPRVASWLKARPETQW